MTEHERRDNLIRHPLRWVEIVQGGAAGLLVVVLVAVGILAYRGGAMAALSGSHPPDVVIVIVLDALRADRLSSYGYTGIQTPHIDSLARDGVLYRDMNTQTAWTKPSVATILTSLYSSSHRVLRLPDMLSDELLTLPEVLAGHDYYTAGFVANTNLFHELNYDQGFAEYYDLDPLESAFYHNGDRAYQEAERVNWRVLPWLEANHNKRFFLYVHYMDTHGPYFAHPYTGLSYYEKDPALAQLQSDLYDGEIVYFDEHLGKLLATLKRLDLYDRALIVFTSDHGEEFYEHQGWTHSRTLYQEITAVPLIVKYPGNVHAGTIDEGLARTLDIAPTILDVAGIEQPAVMRGVSLRLPPDSPARPQTSYAETFWMTGVMSVRDSRFKLVEVVDGDLRGRAPTQLYDLLADPGETTNVAAMYPDVVAQLRATMSETVALAERGAVGEQQAVLSPEFQERLRQLGY
ncbi:MAG: sulfatase-like hydrolase/transferase [Chloroflexi bacterium]|nr:sulfatase-like hydrolase/transferase [Chloroflexota bacterium]MBU1751063.1 sulfatase-like hydrolase/transferase [Chloroflexota bacterium]MBU1877363.1 sulfatase-like hydrolase/transferase [Chloroflexota bacterium]